MLTIFFVRHLNLYLDGILIFQRKTTIVVGAIYIRRLFTLFYSK